MKHSAMVLLRDRLFQKPGEDQGEDGKFLSVSHQEVPRKAHRREVPMVLQSFGPDQKA